MFITLQSDEIILKLLPMGATIYQIHTKNSNGDFKNIVLTHKNIKQYDDNIGYFGATCGRVAGRIKGGEITIDNNVFNLSKNEYNSNTLHGGYVNLSKVLWDYEIIKTVDKSICLFKYKSSHLDEGFPGNVDLKVEYILKNNKLKINYYGRSDRKTYLNLTNHSYFNLSDSDETIYEHSLQIAGNSFLEMNEQSIPIDIKDVKNTDFDYLKLTKIGDIFAKNDNNIKSSNGYNHSFKLNKEIEDYSLILKDTKSQRSVKIKTTYPHIVLYTYNEIEDTILLNRKNVRHAAIAIEPQYAPNAINDNRFFIDLVDVNKSYFNSIEYLFNE